MILITTLSLLTILSLQQVNHTAVLPIIAEVKIKPQIKTVPSKHSFNATYRGIGYEISGKVYETNEGLLDSQVHNKSFYKRSTSCRFYNSQISLQVINDNTFSDNLNIQTSFVSPQLQTAFLLINNNNYLIDQSSTRVIVLYEFSDIGYSQRQKNISISEIGLNDSSQIDIAILEVNKVLIVTDGVKFVGLDVKNLSNYWEIKLNNSIATLAVDYQFASSNQIIQFDLCHIDINAGTIKIVVLWNSVIKVYQFSLDLKTTKLVQELTPPTGKFYTSAVIDHDFYALIQGQLVAYRAINSTTDTAYIDLESKQCWGINKYESTLHIICKQGGLNYVAEFYFDQNFVLAADALRLNRYYTQIDDARFIFRFGIWENPKLMISGDNDLFVTAYGINRQVLIDSNEKQTINRYKSLGLEDIITIPSFSNLTSTFAVGIATQFIVFFRINESPSEVECALERRENMVRWNILVEVNTTSCFANGEVEQLQSICQISVPYTFYVSLFEVDSSKEMTVNIFVYVILIACGLLLLGCAFHCKSIRSRALQQIQKKIQGLKKKKTLKPI